MRQEPDLPVNPSGVARQTSGGADDPVTGDNDGNRIMAHRAADSLRGHCFPAVQGGDFPGDFSVGRHCSVGNPAENLPYRLSEFTSRRIKLQLRYPGSFSRKIAIKPFPGPNQHRNAAAVFRLALQGSRKILLALKPDSDKGIAFAASMTLPSGVVWYVT